MGRRKRKKYEEQVTFYSLSPETKKWLVIIFLFTFSFICILSFLGLAGTAGSYLDRGLGIAFGLGRFFLPLILIAAAYSLTKPENDHLTIPQYVGLLLLFAGLHALFQLFIPFDKSFEPDYAGLGGGVVGYVASYPLMLYLGFWASLLICAALTVAGFLLMFDHSFWSIVENIKSIFVFLLPKEKNAQTAEVASDEDTEEEEKEISDEEAADEANDEEDGTEEVKFQTGAILAEKKQSLPRIRTPKFKIELPLSLLDDKQSKPTSGDIKLGIERIQRTLENFHIPVEMGEVKVGPTVTQYTLKPAEGIKLSRITALSNDLALALAAHPIRIEAPIPGKSLVGIEVPNARPAMVRLREILDSKEFKKHEGTLEIALGKDVAGKCWSYNLAKMPHMLVAGSTGSGKSVCLNNIILSLLYQNNPDTMRMVLVDPKRVEFPVYNGIPHLLTPVITDVTKTVYALRWALSEMDRRFDELSKVNKRNIDSYNASAKEKMPFIVIIIDELADLMIAAGAEVESCIIRLTQMARAVGIHLVVATQRPSVDVITGLIKANIPTRIAFSVASLMDSRTILDQAGAEKLVGKGDMLFMSPAIASCVRIQGAYLSDNEIKRVVDYLKNANTEGPLYEDSVVSKPGSGGNSFEFNPTGNNDGDELFAEAKNIVVQAGKASASLLQRRLRVGYARAARLIDLLEDAGIVSAADGAKPREVLLDKVKALAMKEQALAEHQQTVTEETIEPAAESANENSSEENEETEPVEDFPEESQGIEEADEKETDEEQTAEPIEPIRENEEEESAPAKTRRSTPDEEIY